MRKEQAFRNEVSPLGLLEQNSRRLANKLHERDSDALEAKQLPERQPPAVAPAFQNVQHPTAIEVDTSSEWTPDDRASIISRSDSVASRASGFGGGGILDSFRLSTLPDFAQPQTRESVYSAYSSRDSVYTARDSVYTARTSSRDSVYTARTSRESVYSQHTINPQRNNRTSISSQHTITDNDLSPLDQSSAAFPPQVLQPSSRSGSPVSDTSSLYTADTHFDRPERPRVETRLSRSSVHSTSPNSPSNFGSNFQSFPRNSASASTSQLLRASSPQSPNNHSAPQLVKPPRKKGEEDGATKLFSQMTPEEHVTAGIDLHEKGDLREAAYHWQYAAYKNDNTAMLLYGLAQRHGWGVRKNPTEAVKWLKRAMEKSIEEFAAKSPTSPSEGGSDLSRDMSWIKSILAEEAPGSKKKAHIGLALYELGMSYLHSWGTDKDEVMALKSFEMAGALGDADALCEAAGMYMKGGKGRKKDLQKAAKLYREAGERGANMVGQSWIYKDKYMEDKKKKKK